MPGIIRLDACLLILCTVSLTTAPLAASDTDVSRSGQSETGAHRRGIRVQMELLPVPVRTAFIQHGGGELTAVTKRTDEAGLVVYQGPITDLDASIQLLTVSATGTILDKQPPRHRERWLTSSATLDTSMWATPVAPADANQTPMAASSTGRAFIARP